MARSWADEELGDGGRPRPPPQRAPRPPSLLSFLRGGSAAGRRRWRRRERDGGGPLGAEQRMWLMGSDDEDDEEEEEEQRDFHSPTFAESPTGGLLPSRHTPFESAAASSEGAAGTEALLPATPSTDVGDPPGEASDPSKGWTVLLWRRGGGGGGSGGEGGGGEDGVGGGGGRGGPSWGRRILGGVKLVGCGLSGPWALGVFAVTGQVAGEVSGPCAVGSLALAAVAAVLAALCHAELEDVPVQGPRDYAPHAPPTSSSSSSISSHSDSSQSEGEGPHVAQRGPGQQSPAGGGSSPPTPPRRRPTTARALFCGWASLLGHAAALAAACRALSASMDYITGGRVRKASEEKLGALPDLLGHSSPDVLAVGVATLPTVLFVLGLEPWHGLRTMLNLVVLCSVAFFVGAGAFEADPANWAHGFLPAGLSGLVSGSAMSTLAFVGLHSVVAEGRRQRALNIARTSAAASKGGGRSSGRGQHQSGHRHAAGGIFSNSTSVALASLTSLALAFASYFAVATTLTMMVQFRSLSAGTPLVQAFEVRDVDWARLVMAALGIAALALALVEASPPLHRATVSLSAPDGLLPRRLAKEHPRTATPALAILASGLLAAALAFLATPLALLRLASAAPLLAHSLAAVDLIRRRYQPQPPPPTAEGGPDTPDEGEPRDGGRSRRRGTTRTHAVVHEDKTRTTVKTLKEGLAFLRKEATMGQIDKAAYQSLPTSEEMATERDKGPSPASTPPGQDPPPLDEEPLLSSAHDSDPIEAGCMASSSEDGGPVEGKGGGAAEGCESGLSGYESDSNTDIDAIVAEYKERLKVATLDGSGAKAGESPSGDGQPTEPSAATGRRVTMALCGLLACSVAAGGSVLLLAAGAGASAVALAAASSFVAFLLLALIARQPQGRGETPPGSFRMPLVPWLPGVSLCLHVGLLLQVLVSAWMPFIAWTLAGCCLYYWKRGRRRRQSPVVPSGWGPRRSREQQSHHYLPHRRPREQVRLRPPPRHSVVSSLIPSHRRAPDESIRRLTQVDTILITR
ncbi:probable cationic amino acid transporter [Hetaerina americana]|uniref:probable cationic amino acid transporter n=1 Tax=Hetaerina americana TaxID=62018 RepID=UPI003A7F443A